MSFRAFLVAASVLILIQMNVFGLYRAEQHSFFESERKTKSFVFVNRLSYGLQLPFFGGMALQWAEPKCGDVIIVKTKTGKRVLKRVIGLPADVFLADGKRHIVPLDSLFVGENSKEISFKNGNFGFVKRENNCGKVFFYSP